MTNSNLSYQLMSLNYSNNITKTAQQWGWSERLSEWANFGGARIENKSDIFKLMMDNLRSIDNGVRATLLGKTIGDQAPYAGEIAIKKLLDLAQKSYDDKEYLLTISYLDQFYQKVLYSAQLLKNVKAITANLNKEYFKSLAEELTPEQKENIKKYLAATKSEQYLPEKERQEIEKSRKEIEGKLKTSSKKNKITKQAQFHKTAGLLDWIGELLNSRKSALSLWEKINPEASKNLKKDLRTALSASNRLLSALQTNLNTMSKARIDRKVADYLKPSQNIIDQVDSYSNTINNSDFSKYTSDLENVFNQIVPPEKQKQIVNSPSNTTSSNSRALAAQVSDPKNVSIPAPSAQQAAAVPSAAPAKVASAVQAVVKAEPAINNAQQALAAAPTPENPKAAGILQSAKNALGKLKDAIVGLVSNPEETPQAIVNENIEKINQSLREARNSIPPETIAKVEEAVNAIENIEEDVNLDSLLPIVKEAKEALAVNPPTAPEAQPAAQEMSGFFARLINSIKNRGKAKVEQINQAVVEIKRGVEEASSALQAIDDLSRAGEEGLSPQVVQAAQEAAKELNNAVPPEVGGKNWFARAVNSIRDFIGIPANTSAEATIDGKKQNVRIQNVDKSIGQISVITSDGRQAILPPENISLDDLGIQINRMAGGVPDVASITDFDSYIRGQYRLILDKLIKVSSLDELAKPIAELKAAIDEVTRIVDKNPAKIVSYNLNEYNNYYNSITAKFTEISNRQNAKQIEQVEKELTPVPNIEEVSSIDTDKEYGFKVGDVLNISSAELFDLSTEEGSSARGNPVLRLYLETKGYKEKDPETGGGIVVSFDFTLKDNDLIPIKIKSINVNNKQAKVIIDDFNKILKNINLSSPEIGISLDKLKKFGTKYTGSTDGISAGVVAPSESDSNVKEVEIDVFGESDLYNNRAEIGKITFLYNTNDIEKYNKPKTREKNIINIKKINFKEVEFSEKEAKTYIGTFYKGNIPEKGVKINFNVEFSSFPFEIDNDRLAFYINKNRFNLDTEILQQILQNPILNNSIITPVYKHYKLYLDIGGTNVSSSEEATEAAKPVETQETLAQKIYKKIKLKLDNREIINVKIPTEYFLNQLASGRSESLQNKSEEKIDEIKEEIITNNPDILLAQLESLSYYNNKYTFTLFYQNQKYGKLFAFFDSVTENDFLQIINYIMPEIYAEATKTAFNSFTYALQALSNESPIIVASFIRKYANLMQNKNLSNQLIKIANQLI
jgi:hypothetical protein